MFLFIDFVRVTNCFYDYDEGGGKGRKGKGKEGRGEREGRDTLLLQTDCRHCIIHSWHFFTSINESGSYIYAM